MENLKAFRSKNKLKKAALTVIASEVGGKELLDLKNMFLELDADNSGTLTINEIHQGLKDCGFKNVPEELQKARRKDSSHFWSGAQARERREKSSERRVRYQRVREEFREEFAIKE